MSVKNVTLRFDLDIPEEAEAYAYYGRQPSKKGKAYLIKAILAYEKNEVSAPELEQRISSIEERVAKLEARPDKREWRNHHGDLMDLVNNIPDQK